MKDEEPSFAALLSLCDEAWRARDWPEVERLSGRALKTADPASDPEWTIQRAAARYLGSIVVFSGGDGATVLNLHELRDKADVLRSWLHEKPRLLTILDPITKAADELVLLSIDDTDMGRNRLASRLRKLARPDLAIDVTSGVLQHSRLNYYSLTTRGAARCDLEQWDGAIEDLEAAVRHVPDDMRARTYTALSRAFRGRFRSAGDLSDGEESLHYAEVAWDEGPSDFTANAYLAAAKALGNADTIELAENALASVRSPERFAEADLAEVAMEVLLTEPPEDPWEPPF